jgi:hypothetical protein
MRDTRHTLLLLAHRVATSKCGIGSREGKERSSKSCQYTRKSVLDLKLTA